LTWIYSSAIFATGGGNVKKDHLILILFLAVTLISGAMIWTLRAPQPELATASQGMADQSGALRAS
jgi:hypothetical protein